MINAFNLGSTLTGWAFLFKKITKKIKGKGLLGSILITVKSKGGLFSSKIMN